MAKIKINRALIPLKIILFCWFGASACLLPYMTIHMKQLGITVEETALIYTLLPITQLISTPLAGFIADKLGKYKPVLLISLILSIISSVAIMFVPSSGDPNAEIKDAKYSSHVLTFWLYFFLRIVFQIFLSICFTLLDATALVLAETHQTDYGKQRFWAIFATGLFSPIVGWMVDDFSEGKDTYSTDYSPAFHFFNGLVLITLVTMLVLNIEVAPPPPNMWQNIKPILKSLQIWTFMIVVFILGSCWGFVESFLFWYLLDLNTPKYLLGLTLTTGAIAGLPFLHQSEWFVEKAGHVNLLILALVFYLIRFVGYSLITSPWWCIPFEAMEAFTVHLMWVAAATYSAKLSPPGLMATVQGVVGGLHYGVGRGAGSMIGGNLMALFGARLAFRVIGVFAGIVAFIYFFIYYCFLKNKENIAELVVVNGDEQEKECENNQSSKDMTLLNELKNDNQNVINNDIKETTHVLDIPEVKLRAASISSAKSITSVNKVLEYQI